MKLAPVLVLGVALVLAGCSSPQNPNGTSPSANTKSQSEPDAPAKDSPTATATPFVWTEVAVSAACGAAFKAAEDEAIATDGADDTQLIQTGVKCPTVDEWLTALKARPGAFGMTQQAKIDPQIELSALCYPSRDVPVCHDAEGRGLPVYQK